MNKLNALLVYCGASEGSDPAYRNAARSFGELLAQREITLIYGGGSIGLMGVLADAVLSSGGKVIGVIPEFLNVKEVGHTGLTKLHVVKSMHERKALMEKLCDAAVALPGGFGTMEEFYEMLTWGQLGLHRKPLGILNVRGYFDPLQAMADKMLHEGFIQPSVRELFVSSSDQQHLLDLLERYTPPERGIFLRRGQE